MTANTLAALLLLLLASSSSSAAFVSASIPFHHLTRGGGHNNNISSNSRAKANQMAKKSVEDRMAEAGLELPPPGAPKANYQLVSRDGDLLYLSGHLPMKPDGLLITGKISKSGEGEGSLTVEEGIEAAKWCALNIISTLKKELGGDLGRVVKVVKIFGIVHSRDDFTEQHLVMNGASNAFKDAFGEKVGGAHARSAIGTNSLPLGIAVEVEAIVRVRPGGSSTA